MSSGEDKAVLMLKSLPQDVAESVLAQLDPERGAELRARLGFRAQPASQTGDLDQVLREFAGLLRGPSGDTYEPASSRAADETDGPERAADTEPLRPGPSEDALALLCRLPVEKLAAALQGEGLPTVALVLSRLEPSLAGETLKRLPSDTRRDVSVRLGRSLSPAPALVQTVARALLHKCRLLAENPKESGPDVRFRKMADMFRLLERIDRLEVLTALEQSDAEAAARVKELLYRFEDLLQLEDRSMQKLLGEFDAKNLATALKGASPEISEKVMKNLSKRAREMLNEELEFLGSAPAAQIRQAQKLVVDAIQRLDQAGELVMTNQ